MPSRSGLRIAAGVVVAIASLTALLVGVGATLSACFCIPMYGEPTDSCKAKSGKRMSGSEAEANRKMWTAGADESSRRCGARLAALLGGAVFVAEGERSPRAKELLSHECGPFSEDEKKHFEDPVVHPPLSSTHPALCERLAKTALPEAFTLRQEGSVVYLYYFTYEEESGRLRMRDVYTKLAMDPARLWFGSPPVLSGACALPPQSGQGDLGVAPLYAPWGSNRWSYLTLESEDPEQARIALGYGVSGFRRSTERLEMVDGG